jgi:hypothetical protein
MLKSTALKCARWPSLKSPANQRGEALDGSLGRIYNPQSAVHLFWVFNRQDQAEPNGAAHTVGFQYGFDARRR